MIGNYELYNVGKRKQAEITKLVEFRQRTNFLIISGIIYMNDFWTLLIHTTSLRLKRLLQ